MKLLALQAVKHQANDILRGYLYRMRSNSKQEISSCDDGKCQAKGSSSWGDYQSWAELYHQLHDLPKEIMV